MKDINKRQFIPYRIYTILILITISFNASCQKSSVDDKSHILKLDPAVRYGKLDNGFTYYVRDNDSETTELQLVLKAGIYHEDEDQLDYSHLLEHMGYKYPNHFPSEEKYFNSARRHKHASTSYEFTNYYAWMPSEDREGLKNGLQLLRDWAQDFGLDQTGIDVEIGAILGESRVADPHFIWIHDTIENLVLKNTGYKKYSRNDYRTNIKKFDRERFLEFYEDWYRPDLEAAIVVGDVNPDSMEIKIRQLFSDLKNPEDSKNAQEIVNRQRISPDGNNQYFVISDSLNPQLRLEIVSENRNREFNVRSKEDFKERLLQQLYEDIMRTRSKWYEQSYDPPFENFTADYAGGTIGGSQIYASKMKVDFRNDNLSSFKDGFFNSLVIWKQMHTGLQASELQQSKESIVQRYSLNNLKTSRTLANKYLSHFVKGNVALNPEDEMKLIVSLLEEISLKELQDFTSEFGDLSKNKNFIFFKGNQYKIPAENTISKWVSQVALMKVETPSAPEYNLTTLEEVIQPLKKEEVVIENEVENMINVTTITLTNGIKLILKPSKPRSESFQNTVSIRGFRPNNVPKEDRDRYLAAKLAPEVIQFSGAGPYTKFELDKFQQDHSIKLNFKTDKNFQVIDGKGKIEDVGELLNLIYLYADQSQLDSMAFEAWKDEKAKKVALGEKTNSEFYMDEIEARWFPDIPRLNQAYVDRLTLKKVKTAYKNWYSDFKDFTFIIAGDFEEEGLKSKLIQKISAFPVKRKSSLIKETSSNFPFRKMNETIRLENINQAFVKLYFPVSVSKGLKSEVELKILSRALNHRIFERLREGCYAPTARGEWIDREDSIYAFSIQFNSELGNEDNMIRAAMEEFQNLKENGVEQQWFDFNIAEEISAFVRRINSFGLFNFWPDYLQEKLSKGEEIEDYVLKYESLLGHFTNLEDINMAAKNYLSYEYKQQFRIIPTEYQKIE